MWRHGVTAGIHCTLSGLRQGGGSPRALSKCHDSPATWHPSL